jgi:5-methylcytosine-specific restriction endonuclease McrA
MRRFDTPLPKDFKGFPAIYNQYVSFSERSSERKKEVDRLTKASARKAFEDRPDLIGNDLILESILILQEIERLIDQYNEINAQLCDSGLRSLQAVSISEMYSNLNYCVSELSFYYFLNHKHHDQERQENQERQRTPTLDNANLKSVSNLKSKRQQLGEQGGWKCFYCGIEGTESYGPDSRIWHVDHIYARKLGGDNHDDNLVLSCATCNLSKNRRLVAEFLNSVRPSWEVETINADSRAEI